MSRLEKAASAHLASAIALGFVLTSCAARPRHRASPSGLATVATRDGVALMMELADRCSQTPLLDSWSAEMTIRGVVGKSAVRQGLRVAFNPSLAAMRIESVPLHGAGSFVLVTSGGPATLLFDDGRYLLKASRFATVLAALAGLDLGAIELSSTDSGLPHSGADGGVPGQVRRPLAAHPRWKAWERLLPSQFRCRSLAGGHDVLSGGRPRTGLAPRL